eukprot:scaffold3636_cov114-Isochrysis_galbana.AAC.3
MRDGWRAQPRDPSLGATQRRSHRDREARAPHSRQERRLAGAAKGSLPRLDSALWLWHCVRGGVAWAPELR